jgi:peptidylprolyl isomerase
VGLIGLVVLLGGCGSDEQPEQVAIPTSRPALAAATAPSPLPPPTKVGAAYKLHPEIAKHTTESGIEIQDVREGEGPSPKTGDNVTVNYTGWLADGTVFDSSKAPFSFGLGRGTVIKGWDEGVHSMKLGGIRILTIPPALGYEDRAVGKIPGGSTLVFEVELLGVNGNMVVSRPDAAATQPATNLADAVKAAAQVGPPRPSK